MSLENQENSLVYVILLLVISSKTDGNDLGELPTDRPLVIAHRGCSGELPEHTVEAYQRAVEQGADVIECDLAVTKDRELICSHDPTLSSTTDVESKFPERRRTYYVEDDRRNITDYFTIDFTLSEIKTLRKVQNRGYRDQSFNGLYAMATLEENIAVAQSSTNHTVGLYPETKNPKFFNNYLSQFDTTMEDILIHTLSSHGYDSAKSPCFIQSFDLDSVKYMSSRTNVRLIYLISTVISDAVLKNISTYVYGLGPSKQAIVQTNPATNRIVRTTDFMDRVKKHGFMVHPYTFRNEDRFLVYDYAADPYNEYKKFFDLGVDGMFTDFPATMVNYRSLRECRNGGKRNIPKLKVPIIVLATFIAKLFSN